MTPEGKVKAGVKKTLDKFRHAHDVHVYTEWPVPGGYGKSGLDMFGVIYGAAFMIEAKAPGEMPTPRQIACIASAERAGVRVFIIDEASGPQHEELLEWLFLQL